MNEKGIGYALLSGGIVIMLFSLIQVILLLTNQIKPLEIFKLPAQEKSTTQKQLDLSNLSTPEGLESLTEGISPNVNLLPPELLSQAVNTATHFFLMSFIMGFGFKISSLGVMLIRPVYVKMKNGDTADATKRPL